MLSKTTLWCFLVGLLVTLTGCASETSRMETRLIPLDDFFKNPQKIRLRLSPNGEYIAFLMPWQTRFNIHVQEIGSNEVARITESTERDIIQYNWANNNRIVYAQDTAGDENYRAYAVDIDGSNPIDLTPFEGVKVGLVDELRDNDDEMLISMNKRDAHVFDVYRINVNTAEMEMIAENPGNISTWITDHDGRLRIAMTADGVNESLLYRKTESDPFETIITTNFKDTLHPLCFTFDNKYIYVASNIDRDKSAIYKYDIEKGEPLELIYDHPEVDVSQLLKSRKRKVITGVTYTTDKRHYHFFDQERKALQETLEQRLPGYEVAVASMSKDESKVLVVTYSDKSMGTYYYFNRPTGELEKLVDISPWLKEDEMADMQPIQYVSRDGLTIHGYLTIPRGAEPKNLPVIIFPHGGPWARDRWGFSPEVQFLANRGYAILQMNFRGSLGYGKAFWQASFKEWGRTMQDDITDGVNWLIEKEIADPKRIGIYGGSYGGFAVLAGLAFTPDLYAVGVDYIGVSNLFTWMAAIPPYWEIGRQMFYEMIGDPEKDKELLEAASPIFHVDRIQAPLFVAQGANDVRVKKAESDQIVEALRERGVDVTYMVKENEGHGFMNEENRFDFYREMEGFLGKHLGGRVEKPGQ